MARRIPIVGVVLPVWCACLAVGATAAAVTIGRRTPSPVPAGAVPAASALGEAQGAGSPASSSPAASAPPQTTPAVDPSHAVAPAPGAYRYAESAQPATGPGVKPTTSTTPRRTTTTRATTTTTTRRSKPPKTPKTTTTTAPPVRGTPPPHERVVTATAVSADGATVVRTLTGAIATGSGELGVVQTMAWSPDGVTAREWVVRLYGGTFTCTWQPALTVYPATFAAGAAWGADARCAGKIAGGQRDGADIAIHWKRQHKVVAAATDVVAGRSLPVWTISGTTELELTSEAIGFASHREETEQLAPSLGLPTRSDSTTTIRSFGQNRSTKESLVLVALP